ncbi:MAG: hypothetical protein DHS20C15_12180 [Planctomycetota bacterium]|nr:MAG: hypothetical protein DHS20C15_12180 [Planctomycetota bacterium]
MNTPASAPRPSALLLSVSLLALLSAPLSAPLSAQGDPQSAGLSREQMWVAPTAEDWAKPVLITWQRTWEDAVAVSRESGRPILACINMDGEIASEHYAGIRYRQPEVAATFEPYVSVIASVYRHTARDHDENGERVECPRFGGVTCGEHIAIEPILYEQYLDGRRIAPRHIMIELDGSETYDVFYAFDTASVFETVKRGISERAPVPIREREADRSLDERVASAHVDDRRAVEQAFREGNVEVRRRLLKAASEQGAKVPIELLRLAIFGIDVELASSARTALTQSTDPQAVELLSEALRTPLPPAERSALIAALSRLGEHSELARSLATVHTGLSGESDGTLDPSAWARALQSGGASYAADAQAAQLELRRSERLEAQADVLESQDIDAHLELAESFLALASEQTEREAEFARFLFMDAQRTVQQAVELGASGWRVDTALATTAWYLGEPEEARRRATAAVEAGIPPDQQGWHTMVALALFAQSRQEDIRAAFRAKQSWPPRWLADVNAACEVLLRHPHGTPEQAVAYHDFLRALRAEGQAWGVIREAFRRFPDSAEVHARLRRGLLLDKGHQALEAFYTRELERDDAPDTLRWFAGYASQLVAEFERRAGRDAAAVKAYERALQHFAVDREQRPESLDNIDHQIVLVRGGLARLALEAGDLEGAYDQLANAFALRPESAASQDGMNLTAVDTAKMLRAQSIAAKRYALTEALDTALAELGDIDPSLLELPAYEREVPIPQDGN